MSKYYTLTDRFQRIQDWKSVCRKLTSDDQAVTVDASYQVTNDFSDFIEKIRVENGEMVLLKELKGSFGFPFQTSLDGIQWFTKLMMYDIGPLELNIDYEQFTPEEKKAFHIQMSERAHLSMNTEPKINSILNQLVIDRVNPHLCILYGSTRLMDEKHKPLLDMLVNRYKKKEKDTLLDMANVIMTEWCELGDANDYIQEHSKKWTLETWRVVFFQLIAMIALIQERYPTFRHNDLSMANILVQSTRKEGLEETELAGYYIYHIGGKEYYVPDIGFRLLLTDFDYATIQSLGIMNEKINNSYTKKFGVVMEENKSFDCHMMLNWLSTWTLRLYQYEADIGGTIGEVKHFLDGSISAPYRGQTTRYVKYTRLKNGKRVVPELVPSSILENNQFFDKYRTKNNDWLENRVFIEEYNIPKNT